MTKGYFISLLLFTAVAVLSFSCWAFGGKWFASEAILYTACAAVFLGLGSFSLLPGLPLEYRKPGRFFVAFLVAFLAYAVIWSVLWFSLPTTFGEILGSSIGIIVMTALLRKICSLPVPLLVGTALVFFFHTIGYYTGGFTYAALQGRGPGGVDLSWDPATIRTTARLSWGIFYGLGLGAGILTLFHVASSSKDKPSTQI